MSAFLVVLVPLVLMVFAMQMESLEAAVLRHPDGENSEETPAE